MWDPPLFMMDPENSSDEEGEGFPEDVMELELGDDGDEGVADMEDQPWRVELENNGGEQPMGEANLNDPNNGLPPQAQAAPGERAALPLVRNFRFRAQVVARLRQLRAFLVRRVIRLLANGGLAAEFRHDDESSNESSSDEEVDGNVPQQDLDVQVPAAHNYLFSTGSDDLPSPESIEPGKRVELPFVCLEAVLLPDQYLPLQTELPSYRSTILFAVQNHTFLAMLPFVNDDPNNVYGTLMQINRFSDDGTLIKVHGVGKQRFRLLERHTQIDGSRTATVEVLNEYSLTSILQALLPTNLRKCNKNTQLRVASNMCGIPSWVMDATSTESKCCEMERWMHCWFSEAKVKSELEQGHNRFSFFVAANIPLDISSKVNLLRESCTDKRISDLHRKLKKMSGISCVECNTELCASLDICNLNAEGTSSHFVNNGGYVHEMITLMSLQNFVTRGRPSSEYSWFSGYKWQIIECERCLHHIGWEFTSKRFLPSKFYGLTRKAVKPSTVTRNTNDEDVSSSDESLSEGE